MPRRATRPGEGQALVQLLWAPSTKVGRSGTTVGAIVDAAIVLSDAEGLPALTMRGLAGQVGVGAMTLYGYVPGRPELLELMLDRVSAQTYDGHAPPADHGGWRAALEHVARRTFEQALEHPWVTEIPPGRPVLGPGVCRRYELELTPLDGIGLSDQEMDHVLSTVTSLAVHCARWQHSLDRVRAQTGVEDQQWWEHQQPELAAAMGTLELPISTRVGTTLASAGEPLAVLHTGLGLLLDGVAAKLA